MIMGPKRATSLRSGISVLVLANRPCSRTGKCPVSDSLGAADPQFPSVRLRSAAMLKALRHSSWAAYRGWPLRASDSTPCKHGPAALPGASAKRLRRAL